MTTTGSPSTAAAGTARPGDGFAALRHRQFALFWVAAVVSNIGTWMQMLTVPFVVYDITDSTGWLSLTVVAAYLPQFLVGPLAGATADRFPRRTVLLVSLGVQMVLAVVLAVVWAAGVTSVGLVLVIVVVSGIASGFQIICWQAFVPSLVPRSAVASAVRLNSVQFMLGRAVGPVAAGFVLGRYGPGTAFTVNAVSFAGVMVVLLCLDPVPGVLEPGRRVRTELREGWAYVRDHPSTRMAILNAAMVMFLAYAVVQLAPAIARDGFDVGEAGYATLLVGHGVGSLAATIGLTILGHRFRRSRTTAAGLVSAAAGTFAIGATGLMPVGVAGFLLIGVGQSLVSVSQNTAIQLQVDEAFRGRVVSLYITANIGAVPIGGLVLGALATAAGIAAVPVASGALLGAYTAVAAFRSGGFRGLDGEGQPARPA